MSIFLLPIIAAAIGWFTNYLAVKMLFHPKREINLYLFKLYGIFPKRKHILAANLANVVSTELFSSEDLMKLIDNEEQDHKIKSAIEDALDDFLENKLPEVLNPLMAAFLSQKRIAKIKSSVIDQIELVVGNMKSQYINQFDSDTIYSIIEKKIMDYPNDKLESVLMAVMKNELRYIEVIGAVIGFLIGLIQIGIIRFL